MFNISVIFQIKNIDDLTKIFWDFSCQNTGKFAPKLYTNFTKRDQDD